VTPVASAKSDESAFRSRYPGTHPFNDTADDRARFFGRAAEGDELYLRVLSVDLLIQFGKSGLGKTSLLQAWLFPRLREKAFLPIMIRLNQADESLARSVQRCIEHACQAERLQFTPDPSDGVWELLSTTTLWRDDLLLTPVLVFDQFEEVFTLRDAKLRSDFAAEIGAIISGVPPQRLRADRSGSPSQSRPKVKIVISLREDYLGALQEFSAAIPTLFNERLRLEPLAESAARQSITGPARLIAGSGEPPYWAPAFDFEPPALERMLTYLRGKFAVIEPFQLQLLCRHAEKIAYAKRGQPNDTVSLTSADFAGRQDFDSVLKNFYRDTLRKLPPPQRKKARELCEEALLNNAGQRMMLEEGQIQSEFGIKPESLSTLSQERLVRRERRMESAFYEISHDRLAESILKSKSFRLPKRWRRRLWAVAVLAPVVLAALGLWVFQIKEERQKAEGLVSFLLGERFLGEVRDTGRSDMLEQVRYKLSLSEPDVELNRGLALRNEGDLKRAHGELAQAVERYQRALEAVAGDRREAARTHDRLGEALIEQGQITRGLTQYDAAVAAWRVVIANASPVATEDCVSLADSLVTAAALHDSMGKAKRALEILDEAAGIVLDVLFGPAISNARCGAVSSNVEQAYPDGKVMEVFSRAALTRAQILHLENHYKGSEALARQANWLRPSSMSARKNAILALHFRGNSRPSANPELALQDYQKGLGEMEQLRRWDPSNRLWQRERAASQLLVSAGIVACWVSAVKTCKPVPALEESEAIVLDAIAALRELAEIDGTNVSLQGDLGWALKEHANVLAAQGRHKERLARLNDSELAHVASRNDKADTAHNVSHADILLNRAEALAALGEQAEMKATVERSIDLYRNLIREHPDNASFVAGLSEAYRRGAEILRKAHDSSGADASARASKLLEDKFFALDEDRSGKLRELKKLRAAYVDAGLKLYKDGKYDKALDEFRASEATAREYVSLEPTVVDGFDALFNIYNWIRTTQEKLPNTKVEERFVVLSAWMNAAQIAAWLEPEEKHNNQLYLARLEFGIYLHGNERHKDALAVAQEVIAVAENLTQGAPRNASYARSLGNARCGLGMVRRDLKKGGWEEAIRSGLIHIEKAASMDKKNVNYRKELGDWRKYLGDRHEVDGHKDKATEEFRLALNAYNLALRLAPEDANLKDAIRELSARLEQ
jgi:tetratricopeptide (TPR) repeat protein